MVPTVKEFFTLPERSRYLNCAYMSPLLKSVEEAAHLALEQRRYPALYGAADFFEPAKEVTGLFARLVAAPEAQVVIIPSVSYGLASAFANIPVAGTHGITIGAEFPSDYYAAAAWCERNNKSLQVMQADMNSTVPGKELNTALLEAINENTAFVILSSVHWSSGLLFDLEKIGDRCKQTNTVFIVDGTQSVGAMPLDVNKCSIDVLVCAAYKWLMGPYSFGFAYYHPNFNSGTPIEESWINRSNAANFSSLTEYTAEYAPAAQRYQMGEYSQFLHIPMAKAALQQITAWTPEAIQSYAGGLTTYLHNTLAASGIINSDAEEKSGHLYGFSLPAGADTVLLMEALKKESVSVSLRGNSLRVSPHLYNTIEDIAVLCEIVKNFLGS